MSVQAVMTGPRYVSLAAIAKIYDSLVASGLGLPIVSQGPIWHTCLANLFNACEADWILVIDTDSEFTPTQLSSLTTALSRPDDLTLWPDDGNRRDALAPFQPMRNRDGATMVLTSGKGWPTPIQPAKYAGFGLTLIRRAALENVREPWFGDVKLPTGEFLDPDFAFWERWKQAGNTLYVDTECRIGHLDEQILRYNENYELTKEDVVKRAESCHSSMQTIATHGT